jgi:hypothetical protein
MVAKINQREPQHRRYAIVLNTILCGLGKAGRADFDAILTRLIGDHPRVERLYVLDESGLQVTDTRLARLRPPCQTLSICFRDINNNELDILCVDVTAE